MRSATHLVRRCCRTRRMPPLRRVFLQPAREQHASAQPTVPSPPATTASSTSEAHSDQSLFSSSSASSSSASTAALFPPGAPVIVSAPSHFYLSRSEQAVRDASVAQHLHRQRRLQAAYDNVDKSHLRVSLDLSYAHPTRQAATSLMTQLRVIAHHNRTADYPACLHINALDPRILATDPFPSNHPEQKEQEPTAADQFVRDMRQRWSDSWLMHRTTASVAESFDVGELVYLSPDAPHILWRVSPRFVYVVGGLVDKQTVVRKVSLRAAEALRVQSARLPIRECMTHGLRKSALNVNVVFALLLHVHQAAERIRHTPPPTVANPASSASPLPPSPALNSRDLHSVYGLQWYPRRRSEWARKYKRPRFGVSEFDEGIDWYRLWCEAFDAVIPPRLRWDDQPKTTP